MPKKCWHHYKHGSKRKKGKTYSLRQKGILKTKAILKDKEIIKNKVKTENLMCFKTTQKKLILNILNFSLVVKHVDLLFKV